MEHLEFIHQLTQFCILELEEKEVEYEKLVQEEDYSYYSQGYLAGQVDTLRRILESLIHYRVPE